MTLKTLATAHVHGRREDVLRLQVLGHDLGPVVGGCSPREIAAEGAGEAASSGSCSIERNSGSTINMTAMTGTQSAVTTIRPVCVQSP